METTFDLSGHWTGYYTQHDKPRPISADLTQAGDRLTGTMDDDCTVIELPVAELAASQGLPPGADEQIVEQLRSLVPGSPTGPVLAEMHVPRESTLAGDLAGRSFRLRKTYQGPHFTGFRIGPYRVGALGEDQQVEYHGRVNPEGTEIEGHWSIPGESGRGVPGRFEGGFWLRRASEG